MKKRQAYRDQHENDIELALVNKFLPKDGNDNNQQSAEKM